VVPVRGLAAQACMGTKNAGTTRHAYAGAECKRTWETKRGRGRAGVDGGGVGRPNACVRPGGSK
jgi:hypothetical protein